MPQSLSDDKVEDVVEHFSEETSLGTRQCSSNETVAKVLENFPELVNDKVE